MPPTGSLLSQLLDGKDETMNVDVENCSKPVGGFWPPTASLAGTVRETTRLGHLHNCAGKNGWRKMGCVGTSGRWRLGDRSEFQ